jgi:outer membrane protein OmpA-like peptidoglycan-associated protein
MNKFTFPLFFAAILCIFPPAQAAEKLLPEHLQQIEDLQRSADKMAFGGVGSNNYHLAKARTWLDLALSEYHQKDSSGIMLAAIAQAATLLDALDKKQSNISMDTPIELPGSEAVRADLWDKIAALKANPNFSCGQRQIAEAEVYLVWTGHEKAESGWSHAQSYARSAEDLIYEAQVAIANCAVSMNPPLAASSVLAPVPVANVVEVIVEKRIIENHIIEKQVLSTDTLFAFNSAELISGAIPRLDKLAGLIKGWGAIEAIALVGHTDRYGSAEYNQKLSEQRAERIKQYLVAKGIAADKINASGAGSTQPLLTCSVKPPKLEQISCLQPNRRVEITLREARQ